MTRERGKRVRRGSRDSRGIRKAVEEDLRKGREESLGAARSLREEVSAGMATLGDNLSNTLANSSKTQQEHLSSFIKAGYQTIHRWADDSVGYDRMSTVLDTFDYLISEIVFGLLLFLDYLVIITH